MVFDVDHAADPCAHVEAQRGEWGKPFAGRGRIGSSRILKQGDKPNNLGDHHLFTGNAEKIEGM